MKRIQKHKYSDSNEKMQVPLPSQLKRQVADKNIFKETHGHSPGNTPREKKSVDLHINDTIYT